MSKATKTTTLTPVHAIQDRWIAGEITLADLDALVLELHPTTAAA